MKPKSARSSGSNMDSAPVTVNDSNALREEILTRLAQMEARFYGPDAEMSSEMAQQQSEVAQHQSEMAQHQSQIAQQQSEIQSMKNDISASKSVFQKMSADIKVLKACVVPLAHDYITLAVALAVGILIHNLSDIYPKSNLTESVKQVNGLEKVAKKLNYDLDTFAKKCTRYIVDKSGPASASARELKNLDKRINSAIEMLKDNPTLAETMPFERDFLSVWFSDLRDLIPSLQDIDTTEESSDNDDDDDEEDDA